MPITRHSSRRSRLDQSVLTQRLAGAVSYDRIAGYFRSSLFEVAGEALASVTGPVRIICNSDLDPQDLMTAAAVETPVYRREQGLWPHQKYFARLALERHRLGGARLVLADQVGLGKTVQLAMAAMLMALDDPDGGPILVLAPKPLLQQWQDELMELLLLPSARWK